MLTGMPFAIAMYAGPRPRKAGKSRRPDGQRISAIGFTNTEEEAAGLTKVVPLLVEDTLMQNGGVYSKAADWQPHVVTDGLLIAGQNPASSKPAAQALLKALA